MVSSSVRVLISVSLLIAAFTLPLKAQDPCSSLLSHGIYDYYHEQGQSSSVSEIRHEVCSAYQKYTDTKLAGQLGVGYKALVAGISFTGEQLESIGQQMCDLNYSYTTAANLQNKASSVISSTAVQAWQSCVTQYNGGFRVSTDIAEDGTTMDISMYYVPPPGGTYPTVTDVIMTPPGVMTCQGGLLAAAQADTTLTGQAMQLTCYRTIANAPVVQAGRNY
jgi:hypothetical protein